MKITRHIIYLKKLCPVCQQGMSLFPCYCPICNCIIVICDEEGTIFTDINNIIEENTLDQLFPYDKEVMCPSCGKVPLVKFKDIEKENILKLGFHESEFGFTSTSN